ncbi:MAG: hypothetical protein FJZ04_01060 [Candidatus Moranbacteria bacterium]|nr:hypothetical protein [Candidatus Moranbacteria bacterium]
MPLAFSLSDINIFKAISSITSLRPSWGTLILVIFTLLALAITFKQGKGGTIRSIMSIYMAIAVNNFLPFLKLEIKGFKIEDYPLLKIAIFVIIFVLISYMLSHSSLGMLDRDRSTFLGTFVLAFLASGLVISTVAVMLPAEIKEELTGTAHFIFVNEIARFLWVIAPILAIIIIG